jgi:hypothetical protein
MATGDLTTLAKVKDWLNTSGQAYPAGSDTILATLVSNASAFVTSYLSRGFGVQTVTEKYNGAGTDRMMLRARPIISVQSLTVGQNTIAPRSYPGAFGYAFDDSLIYMDGWAEFPRGVQNVSVTYVAGMQQTDLANVPTDGTALDVSALSQFWVNDAGVTLNGVALTLVSGAPGPGQYALKALTNGNMGYAFNLAIQGQTVSVTYGFAPSDVVQATTELVGERFKTRNRIGEVSQNVGNGQTVSFQAKDMNEFVSSLLNQWKNVTPL